MSREQKPTAQEIDQAVRDVGRQMRPESLADLHRQVKSAGLDEAELAECRATLKACPDRLVRARGLRLLRRYEKRRKRLDALVRWFEAKWPTPPPPSPDR
jgi:hypothetical protein